MADFEILESMLREGKIGPVRQSLRKVRLSEVPRHEAVRLANIARRAGLSTLSVKLLNPIVRADKNLTRRANEAERAEYAAALTQIGARSEALQLLESLDPVKNIETLLFRSFAHFGEWMYAKAVPLLETYIARHPVAYQKLVGKVNLAAALVWESRLEEAQKLLADIISDARAGGFGRLHANALELRAQLYILKYKYTQAERDLDAASKLLKEASVLDDFFVMKWKTLLSVQSRATRSVIEGFARLKEEALKRKHWETVRDSDFYLARFKSDLDLFTHLYHGTPFESFRRRIEGNLARGQKIPTFYSWSLKRGASGAPSLNLRRGETSAGAKMKVGQLQHRMITALAADFYRPVRTATLFSVLFPREFYNPQSSPHRVHQNSLRLRSWLGENGIPLQIEAGPSGYRLVASGPVVLISELGEGPRSRAEELLARAREVFGAGSFGTQELVSVSGLSKRTVLRFLDEAKASGELEVAAGGRSTRYRFKSG
ncbi:MAG TPA: hypothetical protein VFV50_15215 [Bdellovibrionales bacterium]|nr:hypothetical protein [Bdellovibrionales bacterium]